VLLITGTTRRLDKPSRLVRINVASPVLNHLVAPLAAEALKRCL